MTYLPKSAWDIQRAVESGSQCASCGGEFVKPHGFPVVCRYCHRNGAREFAVATHEEVAAHYGKIASRKRRDG